MTFLGPALIRVRESTRRTFEAERVAFHDGFLVAVGRYRWPHGGSYRYGERVTRSWPTRQIEVVKHQTRVPFLEDGDE